MTDRAPPRFLTLEGIDGAGKSTHIAGIGGYLRAQGEQVVLSREPGGSELAEALRVLLLQREMSMLTELLLVFAARRDHLERVVLPALARGAWVVCDRFTDATWAYQGGGRGVPSAQIAWLEQEVQGALRPWRTYWFDLEPREAAKRRAAVLPRGPDRAKPADLSSQVDEASLSPGDRFEAENLDFFFRVRSAYAQRALQYPDTFLRLDASQPETTIAGQIRSDLKHLLELAQMQH
jgi:dTMP kinase